MYNLFSNTQVIEHKMGNFLFLVILKSQTSTSKKPLVVFQMLHFEWQKMYFLILVKLGRWWFKEEIDVVKEWKMDFWKSISKLVILFFDKVLKISISKSTTLETNRFKEEIDLVKE